MTWFKIDDGFYDHPKVDDLPLSAVGLWTLTGTYAARHLSNGVITDLRVRKFGGTNDDVTALLTAGLWDTCDEGYQFRNWTEYQPTRESVEAEREKNRKRAQKWREKKRDPAVTSDNVTERNAVTTPHERVTNDARAGAPTRPDPSISTAEEAPPREDVEALCKRLADRIESNGVKRPTITKAWKDDARKLIDLDGYTRPDIERVIDWCQADDFWKSNILSMNKLRKQFGALKIKADANRPVPVKFDPWSKEAYVA